MLYFSSTVKLSILTPTQSRFKYLWKILYAHVISTFVIRHIYRKIFGTKYSGMNQAKFVEGNLYKILLGPFLNTLYHSLDVKKEGIKQLDSISFERKIEFLIYMFDPFPASLFIPPENS